MQSNEKKNGLTEPSLLSLFERQDSKSQLRLEKSAVPELAGYALFVDPRHEGSRWFVEEVEADCERRLWFNDRREDMRKPARSLLVGGEGMRWTNEMDERYK